MRNLFNKIFLISFCFGILVFCLRGIGGNPTKENLNDVFWKDKGPFETSPERGRFALVYSVVEDKSFYFSKEIAKFSLPDLAYANNKFVSLFAPGVSFIIIPGYIFGKALGASQLGSYFVILLFAIFNVILIKKLAKILGANEVISDLACLIFLFATPAFSYAVSLYQHHISTFILLLSLLLVITKEKTWKILTVFFLYGLSFLVDYPNAFLLLPVVIFTLLKAFKVEKSKEVFKLNINLSKILLFLGILPPVVVLLIFNKFSYGYYFTLPAFFSLPKEVEIENLEFLPEDKIYPSSDASLEYVFFKTRNLINGLYTHILSPNRGVVYFSPVLLFFLIGILEFGDKKEKIKTLLVSIIGVNLLIYSMWGDPWGGWAFGSRYLIPSCALSSVLISIGLTRLKKDNIFLIIVFLASIVSISINLLGALTTNANPPRVEAENLSLSSGKIQQYTFERNIDYLVNEGTKSFVYQTYIKNIIKPWHYYLILLFLITLFFAKKFHKLFSFSGSRIFEFIFIFKRKNEFTFGLEVSKRFKFADKKIFNRS